MQARIGPRAVAAGCSKGQPENILCTHFVGTRVGVGRWQFLLEIRKMYAVAHSRATEADEADFVVTHL
jgi:hypothetical protein